MKLKNVIVPAEIGGTALGISLRSQELAVDYAKSAKSSVVHLATTKPFSECSPILGMTSS